MITCYADPNPPYLPAMRLIASITKGNPTTIETTFDHGYIMGDVVRLDIPLACGMSQINGYLGPVTVTSGTEFTVAIDSTLFDDFAIPTVPTPTVPVWSDICAQVVPVGQPSDSNNNALHRNF